MKGKFWAAGIGACMMNLHKEVDLKELLKQKGLPEDLEEDIVNISSKHNISMEHLVDQLAKLAPNVKTICIFKSCDVKEITISLSDFAQVPEDIFIAKQPQWWERKKKHGRR